MAFCWPNGSTTPPPFSWQGHFGWRDADLSYASKFHRGLDTYGYDTVHAIADGEVVHVGRRMGWAGGGYMVWIQHDGFFSRSLHLVEGSSPLYVGQRVTAGQKIGRMGNTNGGAVGMAVHLHLEITLGAWHSSNTGQIDPKAFILARIARDILAGIDIEDINEGELMALDSRINQILGGSIDPKTNEVKGGTVSVRLNKIIDLVEKTIDLQEETNVKIDRLATVVGGTIKRAENGESISQRLDKALAGN